MTHNGLSPMIYVADSISQIVQEPALCNIVEAPTPTMTNFDSNSLESNPHV